MCAGGRPVRSSSIRPMPNPRGKRCSRRARHEPRSRWPSRPAPPSPRPAPARARPTTRRRPRGLPATPRAAGHDADRRGPLRAVRLGRRRPRRRRDAVAARPRGGCGRGHAAQPPHRQLTRASAARAGRFAEHRLDEPGRGRRALQAPEQQRAVEALGLVGRAASRSPSLEKCARWALSSGSRSASRRVRKSSLSINSERASRTWATGSRSQRVTSPLAVGVASRTVRRGPERLGTVPPGARGPSRVRVSIAR